MGVDYRAGIAYGIGFSGDDLYEGLYNYASHIQSKEDLKGWFETDEEFKEWYENIMEYEDFGELRYILYEEEILINLDGYSSSAGFILGYSLDCVDWGYKSFNYTDIMSEDINNMKENISFWYKKLFPDKEMPEPQLLLFSQVW